MTTVLFIHGMNGTAKNWSNIPDLVRPQVEGSVAVQLPGHDQKMTIWDVLQNASYASGITMDDYVAAVAEHFPTGTYRDVVLVGHSMGGAVISHVAAQHPDRIKGLIYMAAMMPDQGQTAAGLVDWIKGSVNQIGFMGDFAPHFQQLEAVRQPAEPLTAAFNRTGDFNALTKCYLRCSEDDVIPVECQDKMLEAYPETSIVKLKRSHFPQFQAPQELADTLSSVIAALDNN